MYIVYYICVLIIMLISSNTYFSVFVNDRILSVRELRSLLSMLSDLPIELKHVESFQGILESCDEAYNGTRPSVEPIEYETLYDPDMVS